MYIIITALKRGALCKDGDKLQAAVAAQVLQGMRFGLNAAALVSCWGRVRVLELQEMERGLQGRKDERSAAGLT